MGIPSPSWPLLHFGLQDAWLLALIKRSSLKSSDPGRTLPLHGPQSPPLINDSLALISENFPSIEFVGSGDITRKKYGSGTSQAPNDDAVEAGDAPLSAQSTVLQARPVVV